MGGCEVTARVRKWRPLLVDDCDGGRHAHGLDLDLNLHWMLLKLLLLLRWLLSRLAWLGRDVVHCFHVSLQSRFSC